jgi:enoyl-CoA hydratase/carnithine racemase
VADIEWSVKEGVGTLFLNRPSKSNAFTLEMVDQWAAFLRSASENDEVRCIVLAASGKNFCAGADLDVLSDNTTALSYKQKLTDHIHKVAYAIDALDKPLIAAVNGAATGAGMDMALMCDMRIAGASARFAEMYIRVGLVPGDGGAYYLPRIVGLPKAMELLLTGDFVSADEALRIGLVNRVVEDDLLQAETYALAKKIADAAPQNIRMIKRLVSQSSRADLRTSLDLVSSHMGIIQTTVDSKEALAAFKEKREQKFVGE